MTEPHVLIAAILQSEPQARIGVLERFADHASLAELTRAARELHEFASQPEHNLYQRVRAIFQAHALYRYWIPARPELRRAGRIPRQGHELLLARHYAAATDAFLAEADQHGLNDPLSSALAAAYHGLGFQLLSEQVQRSVRSLRGNRWMFRAGHALDQPLRVHERLKQPDPAGFYPVLVERTPVRMDLTHSGWSDIFFLGMDYPEGARVLNVSVDLAVHGRDLRTAPPISCYLRVIDEPVLRLVSVDLDAAADLTETSEVFNYASDYLGLLKAAVIASGIVPPALEGSEQPLSLLLEQLVGPGRGLELASQVNDIPKGSRLAVSTNLLGGLISVCMRATGQISSLTGGLTEAERRMVAARAILGEWLGGSGGGWQDSGGVWPGIKLIEGVPAAEGDVEWNSSRGRLLPRHTLLGEDRVSPAAQRRLEESLVVVHGGMAANVGPILEMVTEKFLLGTEREWHARQELLSAFEQVVAALAQGDMRELGRLTTRLFEGPLATIIPWVSNFYTEQLIADARAAFGEKFWGFWMLGGMSGGGMGFIFDPSVKAEAEVRLLEIMRRRKRELAASLPFAMDPVVYRFSVNGQGSSAELLSGEAATFSAEYYLCMLPRWLRDGSRSFSPQRRAEIDAFSRQHLRGERAERVGQALLGRLLPATQSREAEESLQALLDRYGFDAEQHERIRADLRAERIGLAKNRLPADTSVEDVHPKDVVHAAALGPRELDAGSAALARGEVCVITLAAGAGTRWTHGAGTVKAIYPFAKLGNRFRTFIEVHLAKTRKRGREFGVIPPHVLTTSYLTHAPIAGLIERENAYGLPESVHLSEGRSIGLRLVPTAHDLRFAWAELREQKLEERKQKVRDAGRAALIEWAIRTGEASDYRDNVPSQCLHPVGHWYEVANLLLNGTLRRLLRARPELKYAMLHNIDTLGADLDPRWLGRHVESGAAFSFEVVERRLEDRGGGLARVGGRTRLVEGLAFPREEDEAKLTYYNSLTTFISLDRLLELFGLNRAALEDEKAVLRGVRSLAQRLPTYVTLKEVKRRWGNAQEDVFPVTQFEKLWGDMTALPDVKTEFFCVPRPRGQQLKDVAQLDGWLRDGSKDYVESLCLFE
ncbi:MAG TPA: UTP--glucose-1-phosphate uridylyltransferase [Polyangiaceae bacterium]|nr:UTP--glucose-1-phosphate uridylyltransferase [Polyangiaceae bacterium]